MTHRRCRDTANLEAASSGAADDCSGSAGDAADRRGAAAVTAADAMAWHDAEVVVVKLLVAVAGMVAAFQAVLTTEYSSSRMC